MGNFRDSPLGHHPPAVGPCLGTHLDQPIRLGQNLSIVVHQNYRVSICHQIAHHAGQSHDVGGMQADGRFVQHIEHPGGAVAHRPGQLHPLPLPGGERGGGAVQRQVAQSQVHQPFGHSLEGLADALRHGAHLLRQGGGHPGHPLHQHGEGHLTGLVQGDAPEPRRPRGRRQPGAAAVGADALLQKLLHPLHTLLVLHLGQGVFHRVGGIEVGEIHIPRRAAGLVLIDDVLLDGGAVEDDLPLLRRQFPEGHVSPHPHLPGDVLHQRPHQGLPWGHRSLVDGQGLVGH